MLCVALSRLLGMRVKVTHQNGVSVPHLTLREYLAEFSDPQSSVERESELHLWQWRAIVHMLVAGECGVTLSAQAQLALGRKGQEGRTRTLFNLGF